MNVSVQPSFFVTGRRARRGAFALVVTLLILSLLVVVAVSYLTSMVNERQTADAYTSKARAEQIAQSGVDSAMAILTESFRDYPDSATVWDVSQSTNDVSPSNNEGTSLYLRAVPDTNNPSLSATPAPGATPGAANDSAGNNPNNPACKTFVLPLVSGVPNGRAQLASQKNGILAAMNVSKPAAKQNFTDLNVRRFAGDTQGVIGSPPLPTAAAGAAPTPSPTPKPARALWVNLMAQAKDANGNPVKDNGGNPAAQTTGRYAFWIDDESFRANNSSLGAGPTRPDNLSQPLQSPSPTPPGVAVARPLQPSDLTLVGPLTRAGDSDPADNAQAIVTARKSYPGSFFPDPLAFTHGLPAPSASATPSVVDTVRYLTTHQSGTLNFTRHGTQRLNLNGILPNPNTPPYATQSAVDQIVETLKFHLPNFGQRFYRTSTATDSATLNATQVAAGSNSDHATIYLYKVAANICDYIDTDSQPTMILGPQADGTPGGKVDTTPITAAHVPGKIPLEDEGSANTYWAQGKESAPFIQEVVVRYRPIVGTDPSPPNPPSPIPARDFDLQVDYYVEFWNMTDRDVYAAPQPTNPKLPHLNNASVFVRDQQAWAAYSVYTPTHAGDVFVSGGYPGELLPSNGVKGPNDWQIDLASSAVIGYDANRNPIAQDGTIAPDGSTKPLGVCFKAGMVTVITTDPNCYHDSKIPWFIYTSPYSTTAAPENYGSTTVPAVANPTNVFYCQLLAGQRDYKGHIQQGSGTPDGNGAMTLAGGFTYPTPIYSGTEVSLANGYGYVDIVRGAITKVQPSTPKRFYTQTYINTPPNNVGSGKWGNDYSFGGALMGNVAETSPPKSATRVVDPATPSELGDPRTNNEQLAIAIDPNVSATANNPDGSHYMPGTRTLGTPNGLTVKPETTTTGQGWNDYFAMPSPTPPPTVPPVYPNSDATNAPAVIADGPLTSIGQLGDVYDPARIQGAGGILYSRGGGRTFKIGQHDDRYTFDPTGSAAPNNTADCVSASTGWASWRLADVFSIDDSQELPGRININGVARDQGAALSAALYGWTFQPTTVSGTSTDPTIHGDGHPPSGSLSYLANLKLTDSASSTNGATQLLTAISNRLNPPTTTPSSATPTGPFFERGEFGELSIGGVPIFGTNPTGSSSANTALLNKVDMNQTFDHGREEMFRRLSELICTRGDTFTVYTVGQAVFQAPIIDPANPPPIKVTGTHRQRVTVRLVPKDATGKVFAPTPFDVKKSIADQVPMRFARPDHYDAQVLEANTF